VGRFLFSCHDAGGTVPPVLAVAEAIIDRGHEVAILSQPSVASRAAAIGCQFVAFSQAADYRRDVALEEQLDRTIPMLVGESVAADVLAAATAADALVVDPNLAGALAAAELLEQPSAVLLHSLFKTFVDVWFGELWPLLADPINETRRTIGADAAASWADMLERHDVIISPVPRVFDAHVEPAPAALDHVGFLVPRATATVDVTLPRGDEPLVAVSFSTTCQHQEQAIKGVLAALANERVRVVVTTSGYGRSYDSPSNTVIVDFMPHAVLFDQVDVVITHGGLGTTAAALGAGRPVLCVPMGRDQPLNADRVTALGAGLTHPAAVDADVLRAQVRVLLDDPNYRSNAEDIAAESRGAGEAERAARVLERLLE
jgi:MGT family glycosyltransferase